MREVPEQLFYLADWLPPDFGAVGQYAMVFAREIAEQGDRSVCLIGLTSGQSSVETLCGGKGANLEVRRLAAVPCDRSRNLHRLLWALRTNVRLIREVIRHPGSRNAEVLFTGAPPFMLPFALALKPLRGVRLVYRMTDFYPEVIFAELGRRSWLSRLLERAAWFLRRRTDAFEVLGEDQRRLLIGNGIAGDRVRLKRDVTPVAITGREQPSARPVATKGRVVLLYSGNYGVAHEVDTVVQGLIRHHRRLAGRTVLWLNAVGRNADLVAQQLDASGVPVARTELVPLNDLPGLLAAADIHLIALRPQFSGIVLPSKVYACIASRRPILFVGPASSDVHLLCGEAGLPYEHVEPGDVVGFDRALERLARAPLVTSALAGTP